MRIPWKSTVLVATAFQTYSSSNPILVNMALPSKVLISGPLVYKCFGSICHVHVLATLHRRSLGTGVQSDSTQCSRADQDQRRSKQYLFEVQATSEGRLGMYAISCSQHQRRRVAWASFWRYTLGSLLEERRTSLRSTRTLRAQRQQRDYSSSWLDVCLVLSEGRSCSGTPIWMAIYRALAGQQGRAESAIPCILQSRRIQV